MVVTVEIRIDELAFAGLDRVNTGVLVRAFERELTRLLREHDVAFAPDRDVVDGLSPLPRTTSARRLGVALARSVHEGLVS